MKDVIAPRGKVTIEVQRADGSYERHEGPNTINQSLRNKLAITLKDGVSAFPCISSGSDFNNNDFTGPTSGQSGIYITDSNSNKTEMSCTRSATGAKTFTVTGVARSEATRTINTGTLGNNYSSGAFTVIYSTKSFTPISLVDGDQLTVTWQLTIADN
jgi:hypothetical protein